MPPSAVPNTPRGTEKRAEIFHGTGIPVLWSVFSHVFFAWISHDITVLLEKQNALHGTGIVTPYPWMGETVKG